MHHAMTMVSSAAPSTQGETHSAVAATRGKGYDLVHIGRNSTAARIRTSIRIQGC